MSHFIWPISFFYLKCKTFAKSSERSYRRSQEFFCKTFAKVYYEQPEHAAHEQQAQQSVQHSGAQQHAVLNRFNNFLKKAFI